MTVSAYARRTGARPRRASAPASRRRAPPSSALINAVIEFADLRDDMGGGRVMLRLSPAAMRETALERELGAEARRIGDIAVIWDERDEVVFRVLDGGPPPIVALAPPAPADEDRFILTAAALAYIAQSQSTGRA